MSQQGQTGGMTTKPSRIDALIALLTGTTLSDDEAVPRIYGDDAENFMDLSREDLGRIDDAIFRCAGCDWWCEMYEAHDDGGEDVCTDCAKSRGITDDDD